GRRIGLTSVTCLRYPDSGLADVNEEWVVRDIVRWLRRVRPEVTIIWGPDGGYGHPDHIAAGERALTAIELAGVQRHEPELEAHQTQAPDLAMWASARAKLPEIFREETFIRAYPEPGGPPLETDLFGALRPQEQEEMTRAN